MKMRDRLVSLASAWALLGVAGLFSSAVYRLGSRGINTLLGGLELIEWLLLIGLAALFLYGEGILALERRFVPRLLQRARDVRLASPILKVLAPLYGLALVGRPAAELVRSWSGVTAIVVAVTVAARLPDPWRGILDLSVALALAWGLGAIVRQIPSAVAGDERPGPAPSGAPDRATVLENGHEPHALEHGAEGCRAAKGKGVAQPPDADGRRRRGVL